MFKTAKSYQATQAEDAVAPGTQQSHTATQAEDAVAPGTQQSHTATQTVAPGDKVPRFSPAVDHSPGA